MRPGTSGSRAAWSRPTSSSSSLRWRASLRARRVWIRELAPRPRITRASAASRGLSQPGTTLSIWCTVRVSTESFFLLEPLEPLEPLPPLPLFVRNPAGTAVPVWAPAGPPVVTLAPAGTAPPPELPERPPCARLVPGLPEDFEPPPPEDGLEPPPPEALVDEEPLLLDDAPLPLPEVLPPPPDPLGGEPELPGLTTFCTVWPTWVTVLSTVCTRLPTGSLWGA